MKKSLAGTFVVVLAALTLAGCGAQKSDSASSSATSNKRVQSKTARDYLDGFKERGLPAEHVQNISVAQLPSAIKATSGVKFNGSSDTPMQLLQFKTQAYANTARDYFVKRNKHVYTDRKLLFVADYSLGKGWFAKYRRAIFAQ
ncbi:hypothetical protein [Lacticaseibacillus hulanensis]|uniref:hypothetical protein n=1 Tax=Lacticaseibacillus hulanensis TaxID=2493111 RepID=UPI000FDA22B7|nr:hypothetical protein [Lacticaseibacillus hulanensis]